MPLNPKPKPFRGWAVFSISHGILPWTVARVRRDSIKATEDSMYPHQWNELHSKGYTCRRVVVVAEEGK